MKKNMHPARIGTYRLQVPEFRDKRTTNDIVAKLSDHLRTLEDQSERVDTVAFAWLTAYHFACEAHELRGELKDQEKDFIEKIDALLAKVRNAINSHHSQSKPHGKR